MYTRNFGLTRQGLPFGEDEKLYVWVHSRVIAGYDPSKYRQDACGSWICWSDYGNTQSAFGWEIDHKVAVANGGGDEFSNLQALQWQNNRAKSDKLLWSCLVRSSGNTNVLVAVS